MAAFVTAMDARTIGENGAPELTAAGVGSPLVALFFKAVRGVPDASLEELFADCCRGADAAQLADLIVLIFHSRATRSMGKGERDIFYKLISAAAASDAIGVHAVVATLKLLPHYGYWKDYFALIEAKATPAAVAARCAELVVEQLKVDETELRAATDEKRPAQLSLVGKWAPREGSRYDKVQRAGKPLKLAEQLATRLFGAANKPKAQRKYRQLLSGLNSALNTTECLMASQRFQEIEFQKVASVCLQRHRKAFLNEALKGKLLPAQEERGNRHPDSEDRVAARAHLRAALVAKKGVKGKALQPHEIAQKCMAGRQALSTLEADLMQAQWADLRASVVADLQKAAEARDLAVLESSAAAEGLDGLTALAAALPKNVDLGKLVPLCDVSGSMHGTPMEVAIALSVLVSEIGSPAFRDRVLTFESRPEWVDLSGAVRIDEKVHRLQAAGWGGSTCFESALEQILGAAERSKLSADEIPDLIVFSDMQFDCARGGYGSYYGRGGSSWETHFERLQRRFAEVGRRICGTPYPAPRIIFWNLRGGTVGFPAQADAPNVQMLSGFSPALLKLVLTGADLVADEVEVVQPDGTVKVMRSGPTPEETLRKALDDEAFDPVRLALAGVTEGPLAPYVFEKAAAQEEEAFEEAVAAAEAAAAEEDGFEVIEVS